MSIDDGTGNYGVGNDYSYGYDPTGSVGGSGVTSTGQVDSSNTVIQTDQMLEAVQNISEINLITSAASIVTTPSIDGIQVSAIDSALVTSDTTPVNHYWLRDSDSFSAQISAQYAVFNASQVSENYAAFQETLLVKAQEYASYVSTYMSVVTGYTLTTQPSISLSGGNPYAALSVIFQTFGGLSGFFPSSMLLYSFSDDLETGNITSAYSAWYNTLMSTEGAYASTILAYQLLSSQLATLSSNYTQLYDAYILNGSLATDANSLISAANLSQYASDINSLTTSQSSAISQIDTTATSLSDSADNSTIQSILSQITSYADSGEEIPSSLLSSLETAYQSSNFPTSFASLISSYNNTTSLLSTVTNQASLAQTSLTGYLDDLLEDNLEKVSSDASTLKSSSLAAQAATISTMLTGLGNISSYSFSAYLTSISSTQTALNQILSSLQTGSLPSAYEAAKAAYASGASYAANISASYQAVESQMSSILTSPQPQEFSGMSWYGQAIQAMATYKALLAAVGLDSYSTALEQDILSGPQQVDCSNLYTLFSTGCNAYTSYNDGVIATDVCAGAAIAGTVIVGIVTCGVGAVVGAAVIGTVGTVAAAAVTDDLKDTYDSDKEAYEEEAAQLPITQNNNNSSWKQSISSDAATITEQISEKLTETRQEEQDQEDEEEKQANNMELIETSMNEIASGDADNTTRSFL